MRAEALADYLGVPVTTIYDWRTDGKGLCGIRVGKHVCTGRGAVAGVVAHGVVIVGDRQLAQDLLQEAPGQGVYGVAAAAGGGEGRGLRTSDDRDDGDLLAAPPLLP